MRIAAERTPCAGPGRPALVLLGLRLEDGVLVRGVVVIAAQGLAELAHPATDGAPHLGQLLRAEDDQRDDEDDDELERADALGMPDRLGPGAGGGGRFARRYHHTVELRFSTSSTGSV